VPPTIKRAQQTFASYLHLKEESRTSLTLDPQRDSNIYIDLHGTTKKITSALQGTPRVVIDGDIGTGKSHALFFIKHHVEEKKLPYTPIYTTFSGFESHTDFIAGIHRPVMTRLLGLFLDNLSIFDEMISAPSALEGVVTQVQAALRAVRAPGSRGVEARAWLTASRTLTPSKALKAGYSVMLDEVCPPSDLASLYVRLAERWHAITRKYLLLLVDEGESFTRVVNEDAQASIGAGLRQIFDSTNQHLGLFLGLNTPRTRKGTHPMLRSDVRSRVQRTITLPTLQERSLREQFISDLWENLALPTHIDSFFLDKDARRFLIDEIDPIRRRLLQDFQLASPTPRDLLAVLDLIAQAAFAERKKLPLDEATLRQWAGISRSTTVGALA